LHTLRSSNVVELVENDSAARAGMNQPPDHTTRWLGIAMVAFALAIVGLTRVRASAPIRLCKPSYV
jgi:hypothetical protein